MKIKNIYLFLSIVLLFISACQQQDVLLIDGHAELDEENPLIADPEETMDGEWVTYGNDFKGYFVRPLAKETFPGVVMIHEWWGLNQNIKNMAHDLAEEGYVVLAVDLFDGKVADTPDDARIYSSEVRDNMDKALSHLKSATSFLKNHESGSGNVASMGWCFGGGMSMQLSLNEELDATIIYYGALETDEEILKGIGWPVLGIFGSEDAVVPLDSVYEFESSLDTLDIEGEIYVYEGLGHAFANPSNPSHDPEKTEDAWIKTVDFLNRNLKNQ
jgi:carboxymethylenebutenolidase